MEGYRSESKLLDACLEERPMPANRQARVCQELPGVGKDAPIVTNSAGGKQSHVPYRMDLLPFRALLAASAVLAEGAVKYGEDNWRMIAAKDHLNHALTHIAAFQSGDLQDDHAEHAVCRVLMWLETLLTKTKVTVNE